MELGVNESEAFYATSWKRRNNEQTLDETAVPVLAMGIGDVNVASRA